MSPSSVLCIIDMTDDARTALQAAINIAESSNSRLTVLYAYRLNQPRNVTDVTQWRKTIDADATNNFTRIYSTRLHDSGISWEFKPEVGFINDRVEAFLKKNEVGIIVVSSELSRCNKDAFFHILENLDTPLLIVPNKQQHKV